MDNERRKHRRYAINRIAKYQTDAGALPRDCMITDISRRARGCSPTASKCRTSFIC